MFELDVEKAAGTDPGLLAEAVFALAAEDVVALSVEQAEAVVVATQRAINALAARQQLAMDVHAERTEEDLGRRAEQARADGAEQRRRVGQELAMDPHTVTAAALAPLLHLTPRAVVTRVLEARLVVRALDRTNTLAWAGELEPYRVQTIARQARAVGLEHLEEFEARLHHRDVADLGRSALAERARRAAIKADPAGAAAAAAGGVRDRFVRVCPADTPGMSTWTACLPAEQSLQAWGAVEQLACEYARATPGLSIPAARADALGDLILGNATIATTITLVAPIEGHPPRPVRLRHLPDRLCPTCRPTGAPYGGTGALEDCDCHPGESYLTAAVFRHPHPGREPDGLDPDRQDPDRLRPGEGEPDRLDPDGLDPDGQDPDRQDPDRQDPDRLRPDGLDPDDGDVWQVEELDEAPPPTPRRIWQLAEAVEDPRAGTLLPATLQRWLADPDTKVRYALSDIVTGAVVYQDPSTYQPGAALARAVRERDGTCRFPGCRTIAARCQLDHVVPAPEGPTHQGNLQSLCATHHGFKHHAGWHSSIRPDGACTWTAPDGRRHTTYPRRITDHAA